MQSRFEACIDQYRRGSRNPLADDFASLAGSRMLASLQRLAKSLPSLRPDDFDDIMQDTWIKFDEKILRPYDYDGLDFELVGYFTRAFVKAIPDDYLAALLSHASAAGSVDERELRNIVFHDLNAVTRRSDEFPGLVAGVLDGENDAVGAVTARLRDWLNGRLPEQLVKSTVLDVASSLRQTTDARDRFLRWMATTAEFSARNWSRARGRRDAKMVPLDSHNTPTHAPVRGVSSILKVYLSRQTAEVVKLTMEGASARRIAREMGRSLYWVRQKLARARKALGELLGGG